ncbi:SlyX protein [Moraxella cuniculi DSM 21768]|uniref:SlyX protein n=1 Tax=Moraxella cuniculi DSM 21768 TaxID=1122245 RepID=A0A1N7FUH3_9GAMM|nr:SlyX family protein [Moraxella cuniculi]OOS05496.1 SlyX protein [Moraxella cuniculi]SIS03865.1 SlyX protein [Moraxella cuniculi DSM 21768]
MMTSEQDIVDLQVRISFLEDMCETLSKTIANQDRQLMDMQDQLRLIYQQMLKANDAVIAPFDLLADKPPHY